MRFPEAEQFKMSAKKSKAAKKEAPVSQSKVISENRQARFRYEIIEEFECGIVLVGSEVKSLREGNISLNEAYVRVIKNELWLVGADIAEYRQAAVWGHTPNRHRKLLVHKRQFERLDRQAHEKGLSIIPLRIFFNARGLVKIIIGVGRGKKTHDKRESLKKADAQRQIQREMKARLK
jgi:SsrA-binding protein